MMLRKRAGDVTTIALDFSRKLAVGERLAEIISVSVWEAREALRMEESLAPKDTVGYYIIKGGERREQTYSISNESKLVFSILADMAAATDLVVSRYGQGQWPQENCVMLTLGSYDPVTRLVTGGGTPGKRYVVRATVRKEFGDVVSLEDEIEVI